MLFVGMLSPDPALIKATAKRLADEFGPLEFAGNISPWNYSDYYVAEMSAGLHRQFIFFSRLIDPVRLPGIKLTTHAVELTLSEGTAGGMRRRINLDPGYLTEAKVVLATTKDYAHRIYLGSGIYAEVALRYKEATRSFVPLEYTYRDYQAEETIRLMNDARGRLRKQLRDATVGEGLGSGR
jgi:hypothetical protein